MLLEINKLNISFDTLRGDLPAIKDLDLFINAGETLGIVGESGCGKSITSLATMGLLPPTATVTAEKLAFEGKELLTASEKEMRRLRGGDMAMIFQDPMTSLNPSFTVGFQLTETLKVHQGGSKKENWDKAIELLRQVGIPAPETRINAYPHQLSGGMCQRVMIAIAIACRPKLLIADEPTTALDVTIQAQILSLLQELQKEYQMGLILITHDIGVVAQMADRIMVMYAGQCVESGATKDVISKPRHPYTEGLLASLPGAQESKNKTHLSSIPGMVPDLINRPNGCQFHPRCNYADENCKTKNPDYEQKGERFIRCFNEVNS